MDIFAKNIRNRAKELDLPNAEVARRLGLSERRYAHYVSGRNEPDLVMVLKIATVLDSTPHALLGWEASAQTPREVMESKMMSIAKVLSSEDLEATIAQAEALVSLRRK